MTRASPVAPTEPSTWWSPVCCPGGEAPSGHVALIASEVFMSSLVHVAEEWPTLCRHYWTAVLIWKVLSSTRTFLLLRCPVAMHLTHLVFLPQMFHMCRALVSIFGSLMLEMIFVKELRQGFVIIASQSCTLMSWVLLLLLLLLCWMHDCLSGAGYTHMQQSIHQRAGEVRSGWIITNK